MDDKQVALALVLNELGEDHDITSVAERIRIQKAVYLAQIMGVNLGYSYSWYVRGPYSTSLTRDYYALEEARVVDSDVVDGKNLNPYVKSVVPRIRALLAKPDNVQLSRSQWYELLASLHFLLVASNYPFEKACEFLRTAKPHLNGFFEIGRQRLAEFNLANA